MLTHHEMVALAGSARLMMMADGEITDGELKIAASFAGRLGLTEEQWGAIWEEAIHTLPDASAVTEAVGALTRPIAREVAYELLYELATDGTILDPEWDILEWLDEHWRYEDMRRRGKS